MEKLDLVGVQGSDENTAVVISTVKGSLSRVFTTADGCQTWKPVLTNPDPGGSFKGVRRMTNKQLYLLGDPVDEKFSLFYSGDSGDTWNSMDDPGLDAEKGDLTYAAGEGTLVAVGPFLFFAARGSSALHLYHTYPKCPAGAQSGNACPTAWARTDVPVASGDQNMAGFSLAARTQVNMANGSLKTVLVAVGASPTTSSAATSTDDGKSWKVAAVPPTAGLLAQAYDASARLWIAVGPHGSDVSADDEQTWNPASTSAESRNADQNWNALSLPFVAGDGGRVGKLNPAAFKH